MPCRRQCCRQRLLLGGVKLLVAPSCVDKSSSLRQARNGIPLQRVADPLTAGVEP